MEGCAMGGYKTLGGGFKPIPARQRQTFHEIGAPEQYMTRRTRDAAPVDVKDILAHAAEAMRNAAEQIAPHAAPRDAMPPSISEHIANQFSFDDVVRAALAIGDRISALEARRNAMSQQPAPRQLQPIATQQQPRRVTDARCACGKTPCECAPRPAPRAPYNDGRNPMLVERHPGILPPNNLTFAPSRSTRDQNNFGESGQVSRFDSREADRLAYSLPRGSASCPTAKELNESYRQHWGKDQQTRQPGEANARGGMNEARSMALEQNFSQPNPFEQFGADTVRPSQGALNALHAALNKTKAAHEKEEIAAHYQNYIQGAQHDTDAAQRDLWRPKQPMTSPNMPSKTSATDAPAWQGLYESNKGTIGSDPNAIKTGQELNLGGGQTHTVKSGETLSGIQSQYGGGSDTPTPPSRPAGLGEGYGQGQEPGAAASRNEERMLGNTPSSSSSSSSGSDVPTPPSKPVEYGGVGPAPAGTPAPPSRPYSLGGGSQGPGGGGGNNATNPGEASTESFLRTQGIPTGANDSKPRPRGKR
jgi:LysM repeat protein